MDRWLDDLRDDLARLRGAGLLRTLRVAEPYGPRVRRDGKDLVNLGSNDYLGLSSHPRLSDAAAEATAKFGAGSGASRLVTGHLPPHADAERAFAAFKHAEAALLLPTGYTANLAVLTSLAGPGDLICLDKLNHASLIDAAHASGATVRVYPHLNTAKLERLLARFRDDGDTGDGADDEAPAPSSPSAAEVRSNRPPRAFIVTDSVFSMDGDTADLLALCELAERFDAILVVDEAHGTGVYGSTGAGLCEHHGVASRVDVVVSTASKALGSLGGIVTARREVIDTIINRARPFIFSTGVPAAHAATITAALQVVNEEPWRRERLAAMSVNLRRALAAQGWPGLVVEGPGACDAANAISPIIPLVVGAADRALAFSEFLIARGFFAPAIRPPTVAPGACRVRVSLRADLDDADLRRLEAALAEWRAGESA